VDEEDDYMPIEKLQTVGINNGEQMHMCPAVHAVVFLSSASN